MTQDNTEAHRPPETEIPVQLNQNPLREEIAIAEPDDSPPFTMRQIVIGGIAFAIFMTIITLAINALGVDNLQAFVEDSGPYAPLAYIAVKALIYVVAPLTSGPLQAFSGTLFGSIWLAVFYTLIGEVLGGTISFFIARRFGRPVVERFVGKRGMRRVDDFYARQMGGWRSLAIARIILFAVWDFLSYACGLANVSYRTYFLVSVIAGFFPTIFFIVLGNMVVHDTSSLLIVYVIVGFLVVAPLIFRRQVERLLGVKPANAEETNT